MTEPSFALKVLTPDGVAVEAATVSVVAPAALGLMGILAHHAPLVTTLTPGRLTYRDADGATHQRHISAGLLEVRANLVTILTAGCDL